MAYSTFVGIFLVVLLIININFSNMIQKTDCLNVVAFCLLAETSPPSESLANCLEKLHTGSTTTLLSLQRIKDASM